MFSTTDSELTLEQYLELRLKSAEFSVEQITKVTRDILTSLAHEPQRKHV